MKTKILAMLALLTVIGLNAPVKVEFKNGVTGAEIGAVESPGSLQELAMHLLGVDNFKLGKSLPFHPNEGEIMGATFDRPEFINEKYVVNAFEEGLPGEPAHLELGVVKLQPYNIRIVDQYQGAKYPIEDMESRAFYQIYCPVFPRFAENSFFNAKKLDGLAWISSLTGPIPHPILRDGEEVWLPLNEVTLKILSPEWDNLMGETEEAKVAWGRVWAAMDKAEIEVIFPAPLFGFG